MNLHYSKLLRVITFLVFASLYTLSFGQPYKYYCDPTATGDNDGSSWTDAYTTIQACLTARDLEPGDTVFLATATFTESNIRSTDNNDNGFVFQGNGIDNTIIDAEGNAAVFNFSGSHSGCTAGACSDIVWNGMTIKDGIDEGAAINVQRQRGADLYDIKIDNCDPGTESEAAVNMYDNVESASNTDHILSNVTIQNCNSTSGVGALDVQMFPTGAATGTLTMTNCTINNNSGGAKGTVYLYTNYTGMHVSMDSCVFSNNSATNGGALFTDNMSQDYETFSVKRCSFYGNSASLGSAIYAESLGDENYENCLFYENVASGNKGGVIFGGDNGPDLYLVNCTVADNTHSGSNIGGIVMTYDFGGAMYGRNTIYYNNDGKDIHFNSWLGTITLDNCVYGTTAELDESITKNSCTTSDPEFVAAASDNYHIETTGSAYNAGSALYAPEDDLDGLARPQDGFDDIGAFEGNGIAPCTDPTTASTAMASSNVTGTAADITWTESSEVGIGTIIVIKDGSYPNDAADNNTYTADANFGDGENIDASGSYVLYKGTDETVSITGLSPLRGITHSFGAQTTLNSVKVQAALTLRLSEAHPANIPNRFADKVRSQSTILKYQHRA